MNLTIERGKIRLSSYNEWLTGVVRPLQMNIAQGPLATISPYETLTPRGSTPYLGMTVNQKSTISPSFGRFNSPDFIAKVISGDDQAFGELARNMLPKLTNYVFDIFRKNQYPLSKSDAEDVAQDTMLRVSRALRVGGYSPQENAKFTTWIFKIAYNLLCDRYKQLRRRNEVQLSSHSLEAKEKPFSVTTERNRADSNKAIEDLTAHWFDPDEKMHVERVLQSLKEKYRNVLVWVYRDGHTPEEIAEREGVNVNTVHQWLARARKQFKQAYAKL